ncbi:MAG TPA: PDZ domain-containing protein [Gemmatimonadaceae bacterium]|nr:PDZ domain-containing protein [Gemmatimonadaceae bacterium]
MFALLPTVFAGALATSASASAQLPNVIRARPGAATIYRSADQPRAAIGVTTNAGATSRDTLGVLVSAVRDSSPAEKAGLQEGDRIASINGVSLKLAAADVGDYDMADAMSRRLTREINKLKPGDDVELRVVSGGQAKTVRVKTVDPEDLRPSFTRRLDADRATLGLEIAVTGTSRDSLGVLVMAVEDNGPAAKAGIEEGSRIASINSVDLRGDRERTSRDDDVFFRATNGSRLERELRKVKPGDDVDLRVYFNGQFKNVKVKAVRAGDLPRRNRITTIIRDDAPLAIPEGVELRSLAIPDMERLMDRVGSAMPRLIGGTRVVW